jgi:hypothetical protein
MGERAGAGGLECGQAAAIELLVLRQHGGQGKSFAHALASGCSQTLSQAAVPQDSQDRVGNLVGPVGIDQDPVYLAVNHFRPGSALRENRRASAGHGFERHHAAGLDIRWKHGHACLAQPIKQDVAAHVPVKQDARSRRGIQLVGQVLLHGAAVRCERVLAEHVQLGRRTVANYAGPGLNQRRDALGHAQCPGKHNLVRRSTVQRRR